MQDYFSLPDNPNLKTNTVCYALIDLSKSSTGYIDLTGRFLKISLRSNKYILVVYYHATYLYPINTIFIKAMYNNHFTMLPDLTPNLIWKHLPKSIYTY